MTFIIHIYPKLVALYDFIIHINELCTIVRETAENKNLTKKFKYD